MMRRSAIGRACRQRQKVGTQIGLRLVYQETEDIVISMNSRGSTRSEHLLKNATEQPVRFLQQNRVGPIDYRRNTTN